MRSGASIVPEVRQSRRSGLSDHRRRLALRIGRALTRIGSWGRDCFEPRNDAAVEGRRHKWEPQYVSSLSKLDQTAAARLSGLAAQGQGPYQVAKIARDSNLLHGDLCRTMQGWQVASSKGMGRVQSCQELCTIEPELLP
jgi:hypothetical protein